MVSSFIKLYIITRLFSDIYINYIAVCGCCIKYHVYGLLLILHKASARYPSLIEIWRQDFNLLIYDEIKKMWSLENICVVVCSLLRNDICLRFGILHISRIIKKHHKGKYFLSVLKINQTFATRAQKWRFSLSIWQNLLITNRYVFMIW